MVVVQTEAGVPARWDDVSNAYTLQFEELFALPLMRRIRISGSSQCGSLNGQ